jgi:hypothetical protein
MPEHIPTRGGSIDIKVISKEGTGFFIGRVIPSARGVVIMSAGVEDKIF